MKIIIGITLFLFTACLSMGQTHKGFRWIGKAHQFYKIDLQSGELSWDAPRKGSVIAGKIAFWDSLRKEIPGDFEVVPHYFGDSLIITIPGTGQVYHLNDTALVLNRLDRTFFRGYNFNANQFLRNDTIFSIGGEGFWQKHSIITFYDARNQEWSFYHGQNFTPYTTKDILSGYSKDRDAFFSINISSSFSLDSTGMNVSIFDFKTRTWILKGVLDKDLQSLIGNNVKTIWTGSYLLFYNDQRQDKMYLLDPFNNEKYLLVESPNDHFFLAISEVYAQNGYLYSRDITSLGMSDKKDFDSVSIQSLIAASIPSGKVYITKTSPFWIILPIVSLGILIGGFIFWRRQQTYKNSPLILSPLEIDVVKMFILDPGKKFTTNEVNALLQIKKKTYDNQRQIRNRMITNINQQFQSLLGKKELISRSPNTEDKRMMDYYVNPDLKQKDVVRVKESLVIDG